MPVTISSRLKGWLRPRTLRARLALWIGAASLLGLSAFGWVSYRLLTEEELGENTGESREEIASDVRAELSRTMGLIAPFAVVGATGGVYWLVRRVMRPIDDVLHAAARISAQNLDRRLPLPDEDDELRALVDALNSLLARLERGYAAQASFAADASHELRTPLTVIIAELEVALRRPRTPAEWEASASAVLAEARGASRIVDALLRQARAGIESRPPTTVHLAELAGRVVERHATAARQAGLTLRAPAADSSSLTLEGDADALEAAVGSVVANALRYTPSGGSIDVTVELGTGKNARLHVDDSGPGVAPLERERIFTAFVRGDEGRRRSALGADTGSGLGLAMARRIAEAHGGELCVSDAPLGGARFTFVLPIP